MPRWTDGAPRQHLQPLEQVGGAGAAVGLDEPDDDVGPPVAPPPRLARAPRRSSPPRGPRPGGCAAHRAPGSLRTDSRPAGRESYARLRPPRAPSCSRPPTTFPSADPVGWRRGPRSAPRCSPSAPRARRAPGRGSRRRPGRATRSSGSPVTRATRGTCSAAYAGLMSGSTPDPDAVTASSGTRSGATCSRAGDRVAALRHGRARGPRRSSRGWSRPRSTGRPGRGPRSRSRAPRPRAAGGTRGRRPGRRRSGRCRSPRRRPRPTPSPRRGPRARGRARRPRRRRGRRTPRTTVATSISRRAGPSWRSRPRQTGVAGGSRGVGVSVGVVERGGHGHPIPGMSRTTRSMRGMARNGTITPPRP